MELEVICPHCGKQVEVEMQKGDGAQYAKDMKKISKMSLCILTWWRRNYSKYWMTSHEAYKQFAKDIRADDRLDKFPMGIPEQAFSYKLRSFIARVSEFVGLGLLAMTKDVRELKDEETMTIRHKSRKPHYKIADKELVDEVIDRNGYVFWIEDWNQGSYSRTKVENPPGFW